MSETTDCRQTYGLISIFSVLFETFFNPFHSEVAPPLNNPGLIDFSVEERLLLFKERL